MASKTVGPMDDAEIERRFGVHTMQIAEHRVSLAHITNWMEREMKPQLQRTISFMDKFEAREEERDKVQAERHTQNIERNEKMSKDLTKWGIIISFFALVCAICMVVLAVRASEHAQNDPARIFHSNNATTFALRADW
jgi:hypothetical protein